MLLRLLCCPWRTEQHLLHCRVQMLLRLLCCPWLSEQRLLRALLRHPLSPSRFLLRPSHLQLPHQLSLTPSLANLLPPA
jgi:hypothetical protein